MAARSAVWFRVIVGDGGLRPFSEAGPGAIVRLAIGSGCDGIAAGRGCLLSDVPLLAAEAASAGLAVAVLRGPLPEERLGSGRRLPRLTATSDRDEQAAAVALATRLVQAAASFGARVVALDLGAVQLQASWVDVARHFARGECEPGEGGANIVQAAIGERKALSPALVDAGRWALDRLAVLAQRHGVNLALEMGATPWDAGSPRELLAWVDDFRGAPVGPVQDDAKVAVLGVLGLPISRERQAALAAAALAVDVNDAVGIEAGFVLGIGERVASGAAADHAAPRIIVGRSDSTDAEVAGAVSAIRASAPGSVPAP